MVQLVGGQEVKKLPAGLLPAGSSDVRDGCLRLNCALRVTSKYMSTWWSYSFD